MRPFLIHFDLYLNAQFMPQCATQRLLGRMYTACISVIQYYIFILNVSIATTKTIALVMVVSTMVNEQPIAEVVSMAQSQ